MSPTESLHYAIGELAYAIARADGEVQREERKKFQDIVATELSTKKYDFDVSDIIFKMMDKDKASSEDTYKWAMTQIKLNSHYLSPQLKETFINVMEKVAVAFPPIEANEKNLIDRFRKDIEGLKGDPVYYKK